MRKSRALGKLAFGAAVLTLLCQSSFGQDVGSTRKTELLVSAKDSFQRPNVILILADDLGFSDLASYGSEINTPSLSALAAAGVSFSNYHTAASCAPSRAMLLTGVDSHRAGVPNIPEMIPPQQRQHSHYQGVLGRNVVTIASLLQDSGYHTYMAGKWHLGMTPDLLPYSRGFERTVSMADSGADNWEQKPYLPIYDKANWFADGERFDLPDDFYSSRFLIDKTIEFIDGNTGDGQPFFAYVPFQAVHMPVQAPQEFIDRYMGVYDQGWEVLRQGRHTRAMDLGVIPQGSTRVTMSTTEDWDALSQAEKRYQAKRMAVYAAMVEAMDHHIGRLLAYLKTTGQYDNTVFIFTSDNGSEASGSVDPDNALTRFALARQGYTNEYDTLGLKGSFNSLPPSFSSASVSPLAFYKFYSGEGGMRVPLVVAGAGIEKQEGFSNALTYVTDIAPTVLDLTGVAEPGGRYGGRVVEPMIGRTLLPLLRGDVARVHPDSEAIGYELAGNAALFRGDYKIVINRGPLGDNQWHLFNIVTDPGEAQDLAGKMPGLLQDMLSEYQSYVADNGVLPVLPNYNDRRQVAINGLQDRFGRQILLALLSVLVLLPFFIAYRLRYRR
ncbi:arylsulfatase [Congregibacter variabilis]|uniref:Arylsulfatase n=1 Tax=Congregibacter variabilis TaxID=3081200 RepID=A0ABZ0I6P4_9GAMM|nr:arylsulfatase [Congregibacter sp. IMCC43200]